MLQALRLQHFRSYGDESFEFEPSVNIVVGPNACGKTNLLEAILVLAQGSSYRSRDIDLVEFEAPWARLDGFFTHKHKRILTMKVLNPKREYLTSQVFSNGVNKPAQNQNLSGAVGNRIAERQVFGAGSSNFLTKEFEIDNKTYKRLSLERTLPVVFFEPQHLQLITRGPQQRRDYFDDLLARSQPGFKTLASAYRRTLAQRNALLKRSPAQAQHQLFAWNIRLSELASQIVQARHRLIDDINQMVSDVYSQIAHHPSVVKLDYQSQFKPANYSSKLLRKLELSAELDLLRGFTAHGPHREDIIIYLNGQPMANSASRGETRSLLLALKIFELQMLEGARGIQPIFLLDDVFSELDAARRRHLVKNLKKFQTIITTTDADAVIEYFAGRHNLIPLTKG